jgi:hypothetical protein
MAFMQETSRASIIILQGMDAWVYASKGWLIRDAGVACRDQHACSNAA